MIPATPRAADLAACTSEAALLQLIGQAALPLLVVYLESRRPIRLPRRVLLGALLRPLVAMEVLEIFSPVPRRADQVIGIVAVLEVAQGSLPEPWPPQRSRAV